MSRVPLLGGAYKDRSPLASAQETINLYFESNKNPQAPAPGTYYQTPGSVLFGTPTVAGKCRCSYRTTLGTAFAVIGVNVYFVATNGAMLLVGTIADRPSQISMSDNGIVAVIVDGSNLGWVINLADNSFAPIVDASFYGADFVVFLDTFFVFNRPATNQFYISLSMVDFAMLTGGTAFDPLDIAAKSGSADPILGIATVHKELWLIGSLTTEIWIGTGAADFYFQLNQGMYVDHGCAAQYSIASQDVVVFWLMQDRQGQFQLMMGVAGEVKNISNSYLSNLLNKLVKAGTVVNDAVGGVWAQENHAFYVLILPSANLTFVYDLTEEEWFRWGWTDNNGVINRHRANTFMFFNGANMIGDWETGNIYTLDSQVYNDFGGPITRVKTFLHMVGDNYQQVHYKSFDADVQCGTSNQDDPALSPQIYLSWSDDRGKTYGNPVAQSFGLQGQNETTVSWNRLGRARDRIFKLQWSEDLDTSLIGGFAEPIAMGN